MFLWLWVMRDRDLHGPRALLNFAGVALVWVLPWAVFLWHEASLYTGRCGLRQGLHDCGLVEFLLSKVAWVDLGFVLDLSIFAGIVVLMTQAHAVRGRPIRA